MSIPKKEDLVALDWEALLQSPRRPTCSEYTLMLGRAAESAEKSGDRIKASILRLIWRATAPTLASESPDQPIAVRIVPNVAETYALGAFTREELTVLAEIAPSVSNSEICARFADIVWLTVRDHNLARVAIDAYLDSAAAVESHIEWLDCVARIQRATSIGMSLRGEAFKRPLNHIARVLADSERMEEPSFLAHKLLSISYETREGDPARNAAVAAVHAERAERAHNWRMACEYWRQSSAFQIRAQDSMAARAASVRVAECLVSEGEEALPRGAAIAAHFIERAIQAYRRITGERARIDLLHRRLLELQRIAATQMQVVDGGKIDLGEDAEKAIAAVKGKGFLEALFSLCRFCPPPSVTRLREHAIEDAQNYVHTSFFGTTLVGPEGKVLDRHGPVPRNPKEDDDAVAAKMYELANWSRQLNAVGLINPARQEIYNVHRCTVDELIGLVANSPIVPYGREFLVARGLQAGFAGDYGVALHVLIPQIENCIRYFFSQRGVITSKLDEEGVQDEKDLNALLYEEKAKEILGDDLLFEARGLLIKRFGANLRNRMAHGLLPAGECYGPQSIYCWWWALRLVIAPFVIGLERISKTGELSCGDSIALTNVASGIRAEFGDVIKHWNGTHRRAVGRRRAADPSDRATA